MNLLLLTSPCPYSCKFVICVCVCACTREHTHIESWRMVPNGMLICIGFLSSYRK